MTLSLNHARTIVVTTKRGTKNTIQVRHKKPIYHKHPEPKTEEEKNLTELNNLFKPKTSSAIDDGLPMTLAEEYELSKALEESLQQFRKRHRNRSNQHEAEWE